MHNKLQKKRQGAHQSSQHTTRVDVDEIQLAKAHRNKIKIKRYSMDCKDISTTTGRKGLTQIIVNMQSTQKMKVVKFNNCDQV